MYSSQTTYNLSFLPEVLALPSAGLYKPGIHLWRPITHQAYSKSCYSNSLHFCALSIPVHSCALSNSVFLQQGATSIWSRKVLQCWGSLLQYRTSSFLVSCKNAINTPQSWVLTKMFPEAGIAQVKNYIVLSWRLHYLSSALLKKFLNWNLMCNYFPYINFFSLSINSLFYSQSNVLSSVSLTNSCT